MDKQEIFPDGTVIDKWFYDIKIPELSDLGKQYVLTDYNILDDGKIHTKEIQNLIDRAYENGGGVIVVPKGTYLTGALFFKQGVNLYIEDGGVLKGSDDIYDYPIMQTRIEGETCPYFAALINADNVEGFKMCGKGTIDGNGLKSWRAFWLRRKWNPNCTNKDEQRPRLVYISNSSNVTIADLHLRNSHYWTTHIYKCHHVKYINCNIFSPAKPIKAPSTDAVDIDVCTDVLVKNCYLEVNDDICAPVMHGKNGEDGTIQGLFELARIPYVGCGVLGSAVCMDKAVANALMDAAGVPHCKWVAASRADLELNGPVVLDGIEAKLGYPIFVKPANAGSSVGISKVADRAALEKGVEIALREDDKVVFEEFVDAQEVECAAIGNPDDPSTVSTTRPGEILAGAEFYTYDDKYKNGVSQTVIPAHLSEEKLDEVRAEARKAYLALGCSGLSRCDFFVARGTGRVLCNELNTLPGFTSISMYPKLMEHEGYSYPALVDKLLTLAVHRRKGAY